MKPLRVYLDTSVISHLKQDDVPEKMAETQRLWNMFRERKYKAVVSDIAIQEIDDCPEPKRTILYSYLNEIDYELITATEEILELAGKFIDFGVLRQKSLDDCMHIAAAIVYNCDIILSWNFKHIVNYKTIRGVKVVTTAEGYKDVLIYPPNVLLEEEELNND